MKGIWNKGKERGFTLVELLVVIAIIGILATLVLLNLNTARARARDTQRIAHVNQIVGALEQYLEANGRYPATLGTNLDSFFAGSKTPTDPRNVAPYVYTYTGLPSGCTTSCFGYYLSANLEQSAAAMKSDADANPATGAPLGTSDDNCTGGTGSPCVYDRVVVP
jgi:prepilin-type N-terminal cleavage/methylation domain-containing protein